MQARRRLHYSPYVQIPRAHGARHQARAAAENLLPMRPPFPEMADGARRRRNLQMRSMPGDCLMNIILSIKPKWAKLIYEGKKTIEWRKSQPFYNKLEFHQIDKVYLYETRPICRVTGIIAKPSFRVVDVNKWFSHDKECLDFLERGCVPVEDLLKYQGDNAYIYAWLVSEHRKFGTPKTLEDFGLKRPPQSWCYTSHE